MAIDRHDCALFVDVLHNGQYTTSYTESYCVHQYRVDTSSTYGWRRKKIIWTDCGDVGEALERLIIIMTRSWRRPRRGQCFGVDSAACSGINAVVSELKLT